MNIIVKIRNKQMEYYLNSGNKPTTVYLGSENMIELLTLAENMLIREESDTEKIFRVKLNNPKKEIKIPTDMVMGLKIVRVIKTNYLEVA